MGQEKKEEKKTLDLLSVATIPLIMTLGNSMIIPVLPMIEREIGITKFQSSMIITIYSIAAVIFIPLAGFLSDRIGRKKVIIPALILSGLGAALTWVASYYMDGNYLWMLVGRFLQGVGAAGAFPIVIPLVGDLFNKEEEVSKGLGIIETSNTIGKVLSPIVGALLAMLVWHAPFFAFPVMCVISILLVSFFLKTPKKNDEPITLKVYLQKIKTIFKHNASWIYSTILLIMISLYIIFGVLFYLSTILEDNYNIDGWLKGVYLAIPLLALSIASFLAGKWIGQNRQMMKWTIVFSAIVMTVFLFVLNFTQQLFWVMLFLSIMSIGVGAMLPSLDALITEGVEKQERGMITAIYSSFRFVGVALGPPIFSILMKQATEWLFYVNVGIGVIVILLGLFFLKPKKDNEKGTGKTVFKKLN